MAGLRGNAWRGWEKRTFLTCTHTYTWYIYIRIPTCICANMLMAGLGQGWVRSPDLPLSVFIGVCDGLRRLCLESRASHHLGHYRGRHQGQRGRTKWRCLQVNKYIHILWCRGVAGGNSQRWDTRTYLQERRLKEWNGGLRSRSMR